MRTISAMDLRRKAGEWLDRASAGERIVIERDHRPMAVLIPIEEANGLGENREDRLKRIDRAFDRLAAIAQAHRQRHPELADLPDSATLVRLERDARADAISGNTEPAGETDR